MTCPICRLHNVDHARYCAECGWMMALPVPLPRRENAKTWASLIVVSGTNPVSLSFSDTLASGASVGRA